MGRRLRTEIRQDMRRVLVNLDRRWIQAASAEVCEHLTHLVARSHFRHILAWIAHFPGEVDLAPFIAGQLSERAVYIPRVLPDRSMTFLSIGTDWSSAAELGFSGVPQPRESSGVVYSAEWTPDTLVIAPGLAFDLKGGRLGRGGGYYDRFLAQSRMRQATVVGVCWSLQLVQYVPLELHDMSVNFICHERGVIEVQGESSPG